MNSKIKNHIQATADRIFEKVRAYREHLHANPELSYQEHETMKYVSAQLTAIGIEHKTGIGETGIVGIIRGDHHNEQASCIALRADLDALPILEANDVPYKSKVDGVMHACGHDVHTSVLLGAAEILNDIRNELPQPVKLIFQPGEEKNPGGATYMIRDGALENPKVDRIFALHVFPDMDTGQVGFKEGLYMASCDEIHLTIKGKGGHGATPHRCIDPIFTGAEIVTSLQQIVSRKCDPKIPCVLSFGHFEALGATNVIPETAHIKGTFRTMNEPWREEALQLIENSIRSIAQSNGAEVVLNISRGYPYLENHPETTANMRELAKEYLGEEVVHDLPIRLTAEDFSYYSQEVAACFFRLGVRNEEKGIVHGVHHPRFDIDPEALRIGIQMMALAAFS
ncbi:MAG: M20 family metallopeptidase [Fluviicola sp.]